MSKPASSHPRKPASLGGARSVILTLAISITIGLWGLFSKVDRKQADAAEPLPLSSGTPLEVPAEGIVLNLPPIPTLIPAATGLSPTTAAGGAASPPVLDTALQVPLVPVMIKPLKFSRESPGKRAAEPRQPDASTRSSR